MNKITSTVGLICLIFIVIVISGCVNRLFNSAPGCNQFPGIIGGCFSRFVITNVKTEPHISCLKFSKNNCNWPSLSVSNFCEKPVYINGTKIKIPYEECSITEKSYWILRNNGEYEIFPESELPSLPDLINLSADEFLSEFGESCIQKDEKIPIEIKIGNEKYNIQFDGDDITERYPDSRMVHSCNTTGSVGNCLKYIRHGFHKSNCKMMQISTKCGENIELLNERIEPNKKCKIINSYLILDTGGDNSFYQGEKIPPLEDTDFFVDGKIGDKKFNISFTVTKNQCD